MVQFGNLLTNLKVIFICNNNNFSRNLCYVKSTLLRETICMQCMCVYIICTHILVCAFTKQINYLYGND